VPGSADSPALLSDSGCVLALLLAVLRPGLCTHGPPSPSGPLARRAKELAGTLGRLLRLVIIAPGPGPAAAPALRPYIHRYVPAPVLDTVVAATSPLEAFDVLHSVVGCGPGAVWTLE